MQLTSVKSVAVHESWIDYYSNLAYEAMVTEVNLTPKPGLVDLNNSGAHKDMALSDFYQSAAAIKPFLSKFIEFGASTCKIPHIRVLAGVRQIGIACENNMYLATAGINTHKGTIFSLGLICTVIGRLHSLNRIRSSDSICDEVACLCNSLVANELGKSNLLQTAGQKLYNLYGLKGARGEAESGFNLVRSYALPLYEKLLRNRIKPEFALLESLLVLMANNNDTNVASRGGLDGLMWLKDKASSLLSSGGIRSISDLEKLRKFDAECIERNLSPGGSADLLIVTWFLAQIDQ